MKKIVMGVLVATSLFLFGSISLAADKEDSPWKLKPTLTAGYAFSSDTHISFSTATGIGVLGATKIDLKSPGFAGLAIGAELPFALTDRLKLAVGGRWVTTGANGSTDQVYNGGLLSRVFNADDQNWRTLDLLASYAFLKNVSCLKDMSAVLGFRWDRQSMSFNNPGGARGVISSPSDEINFRMDNYTPVFGLTSTFKGYKRGVFGGDVTLGVFGSPFGWGKVKYDEEFLQTLKIEFDDDFNGATFWKIMAEVTALSGKVAPGVNGVLSIFGEYSRFSVDEKVKGVGLSGSTGFVSQDNFNFKMNPALSVVGVKASLAF